MNLKDYFDEAYWQEFDKNSVNYNSESVKKEVDKKIDMINRFGIDLKKIKTALVLGCSFGHFVHRLRNEYKIDARGIDFSHYAIEHSIVKKFIIEDSIENADKYFTKNHFDIITAFDTLEHLDYQQIMTTIKAISLISKNHIFIRLPVPHYNNLRYVVDYRFWGLDKSHQSIYPPMFWIEHFEKFGGVKWEKEISFNCNTPQPSVESWIHFKKQST